MLGAGNMTDADVAGSVGADVAGERQEIDVCGERERSAAGRVAVEAQLRSLGEEMAIYDGDTPHAARRAIRGQSRLILSNPDMLHVTMLPGHRDFIRFLSNLRFVVVDEAHAYRGAFGCHAALIFRRLRRLCAHGGWVAHAYRGAFGCHAALIFRRMRRLCAHGGWVGSAVGFYGSDPIFIVCSATCADPKDHVRSLLGVDEVTVVDGSDDGSPCGRKSFVLWNPPITLPPVSNPLLTPTPRISGSTVIGTAPPLHPASAARLKEAHAAGALGLQVRWLGLQVPWDCRCGGTAGAVGLQVRWDCRCGGTAGAVGLQASPIVEVALLLAEVVVQHNTRCSAPLHNLFFLSSPTLTILRFPSLPSFPHPFTSPIVEVSLLLAEMVQHDLRCLAFCKTRKLSELVLTYTKEVLRERAPHLVDTVLPSLYHPPHPCRFPSPSHAVPCPTAHFMPVVCHLPFCHAHGSTPHTSKEVLRERAPHLVDTVLAYRQPLTMLLLATTSPSLPHFRSCLVTLSALPGRASTLPLRALACHELPVACRYCTRAPLRENPHRIAEVVLLLMHTASLWQQAGRARLARAGRRAGCRAGRRAGCSVQGSHKPFSMPTPAPQPPNTSHQDRRRIERELFHGRLRAVAATSALELGVDVGALDATLHLGFHGSTASLWQQAGRAGQGRDRRHIERELFHGRLRAVAATSALELGVDVGALDATLHLGFHGSTASLWQQAGRAGRREKASLSIYVAFDGPLDQYFMAAPERLFSRPIERCQLDAENPLVMRQQLQCAAAELPLLEDVDGRFFGPSLAERIAELAGKGVLGRSPENPEVDRSWRYIGEGRRPAQFVPVRAIDPNTYAVVETRTGRVLEEIEESKAFFVLYEGAVYLQQGRTFLVTSLDLEKREARCVRADVRYYTKTIDMVTVTIKGGTLAFPYPHMPSAKPASAPTDMMSAHTVLNEAMTSAAHAAAPSEPMTSAHVAKGSVLTSAQTAPCEVTTRWTGYRKMWRGSGEPFETVEMTLPDVTYATQSLQSLTRMLRFLMLGIQTVSVSLALASVGAWGGQAVWVGVAGGTKAAVEAAGSDYRASLHAAAHALANMVPLFLSCMASDMGVECASPYDSRFFPQRLLLYDKHPGGIGLAVQVCPIGRGEDTPSIHRPCFHRSPYDLCFFPQRLLLYDKHPGGIGLAVQVCPIGRREDTPSIHRPCFHRSPYDSHFFPQRLLLYVKHPVGIGLAGQV
ncbi:unnamed protein product [Closterium sp. NIES-65]|nr:unnamed protein product [Closterium sp. NIES-65]